MQTNIIEPTTVKDCWHLVEYYIQSFVENSGGRFTKDDVLNCILEQRFQLWVTHEDKIIKGAALTQLLTFPQLKELQIIMCSGQNYKDWYKDISVIERFAKDMGCKIISSIARKGWVKVLGKEGYIDSHVFLEKDL